MNNFREKYYKTLSMNIIVSIHCTYLCNSRDTLHFSVIAEKKSITAFRKLFNYLYNVSSP